MKDRTRIEDSLALAKELLNLQQLTIALNTGRGDGPNGAILDAAAAIAPLGSLTRKAAFQPRALNVEKNLQNDVDFRQSRSSSRWEAKGIRVKQGERRCG
jgi:hypothetical protein